MKITQFKRISGSVDSAIGYKGFAFAIGREDETETHIVVAPDRDELWKRWQEYMPYEPLDLLGVREVVIFSAEDLEEEA